MGSVGDNRRTNIRTYSNYGYSWIVILLMLSCTKYSGAVPDYYFYFSWKQYEDTRIIKYYRNEFGRIMPYTDYTNPARRKYTDPKYRKTYMFVGRGTMIGRSEVNKNKVIFPAKSFKPDEDY